MQPRNRYIRVVWRGMGGVRRPVYVIGPAVLTGATCKPLRVVQIGVFIPTDALHLKLAPYNPARERQSKNGVELEGVPGPGAGRRPANGVGMLLFVWSLVALGL